MENGSFYFNSYQSDAVKPNIEYLKKQYDTDFVTGCGFKSDNRIVIITEDFAYHKDHFGPAKYDLHIFTAKQEPVTIKNVISGSAYNSFFVDDITNDNEENIGVRVRVHINPGLPKCDDGYIGYAEIDKNNVCHYNPFIFTKRRSERGYGDPPVGIEENGGKMYVVTGEELNEDEALEYSQNYYEKQLENQDYEREEL